MVLGLVLEGAELFELLEESYVDLVGVPAKDVAPTLGDLDEGTLWLSQETRLLQEGLGPVDPARDDRSGAAGYPPLALRLGEAEVIGDVGYEVPHDPALLLAMAKHREHQGVEGRDWHDVFLRRFSRNMKGRTCLKEARRAVNAMDQPGTRAASRASTPAMLSWRTSEPMHRSGECPQPMRTLTEV